MTALSPEARYKSNAWLCSFVGPVNPKNVSKCDFRAIQQIVERGRGIHHRVIKIDLSLGKLIN
jgi:hypothetical protein